MSYKTDFSTVYHNNVNISINKKGGAYSAPTLMSVPSLKRNVILLSACTVAVSESVIHKAHNETIPKCRFAEKPCAASIFAKRKGLIVSNTFVSKLSTLFGGIEGSRTPVRKKVLTTFYERSYLFILCAPTGNNTLRFEKALLFMTGYKAVCPCTVTAK